MSKYWEQETPIESDTGKNVLKYFQQAGKLQISMPNWTDGNGEKKQGKTVTLDITALKDNKDALELVRQIIA